MTRDKSDNTEVSKQRTPFETKSCPARPTAGFDFRYPLDQSSRHLPPLAGRVKSVGSQWPDFGDPGHQSGAIPVVPAGSAARRTSHPILLTFSFRERGGDSSGAEGGGRSHTLATPGRRLKRQAVGPPQVPFCPFPPQYALGALSVLRIPVADRTQKNSALCPGQVPGCPPPSAVRPGRGHAPAPLCVPRHRLRQFRGRSGR